MNIDTDIIQELKDGYHFDEKTKTYHCDLCQALFSEGEVFHIKQRFFCAKEAIKHHVQEKHAKHKEDFILHKQRYNTLTDNQKQMLCLFQSGKSDKEIVQKLALSPSTVRHQKFMFREKWKQAKLYMTIYESVFAHPQDIKMMEIHETAPLLDDRFVISDEEKNKILSLCFTSLSPLKLKNFPGKEKKKIVILTKICEQFEQDKKYTEKEINAILENIYPDYDTLRRYLIEYRNLDRTKDGASY